jgi:hypothetical protein
MATPRKWSNVAVAMQSALAAAQTITGITKASPGVVTTSGSAPANGSYVLMTVNGMYQVTNRVFRTAGLSGLTFQLEGEDTTNYDTFTSGSFQVITLGNSITTATNISASGGDFDFIDTTVIHANVKSQIPGSANPSTFTFENIWDPTDAGLLALKAASDAAALRSFKFTFGTGGPIMVCAGYVGCTLLPTGEGQGLIKTSAVVTLYGTPTYYSA